MRTRRFNAIDCFYCLFAKYAFWPNIWGQANFKQPLKVLAGALGKPTTACYRLICFMDFVIRSIPSQEQPILCSIGKLPFIIGLFSLSVPIFGLWHLFWTDRDSGLFFQGNFRACALFVPPPPTSVGVILCTWIYIKCTSGGLDDLIIRPANATSIAEREKARRRKEKKKLRRKKQEGTEPLQTAARVPKLDALNFSFMMWRLGNVESFFWETNLLGILGSDRQ